MKPNDFSSIATMRFGWIAMQFGAVIHGVCELSAFPLAPNFQFVQCFGLSILQFGFLYNGHYRITELLQNHKTCLHRMRFSLFFQSHLLSWECKHMYEPGWVLYL